MSERRIKRPVGPKIETGLWEVDEERGDIGNEIVYGGFTEQNDSNRRERGRGNFGFKEAYVEIGSVNDDGR
ncbi:hypothetical protein V6N11_025459 [Hibiscus sabdariffa]|uniref:Uncharacterized protein n=1 Tax=Hibiscus sabdariffa TaxID=183260 RepID=A0ABR2NIF6_9ROSI